MLATMSVIVKNGFSFAF